MSQLTSIMPATYAASNRSNVAALDQRVTSNTTKLATGFTVGGLALTAIVVYCKSTMNRSNDESMAKLDTIIQSLQLVENEINSLKGKNTQLTNQIQLLMSRTALLEFRVGQTSPFPGAASATTMPTIGLPSNAINMPVSNPSILLNPNPIISNTNATSKEDDHF